MNSKRPCTADLNCWWSSRHQHLAALVNCLKMSKEKTRADHMLAHMNSNFDLTDGQEQAIERSTMTERH